MGKARKWFDVNGDAASLRALIESRRVTPLDVHTRPFMDDDTKPREPGCECHWEEGDSPCPVHGDEG